MNKKIFFLTFLFFSVLVVFSKFHNTKKIVKTDFFYRDGDCVPNKQTAIKIAKSVWLSAFGKRIYKEMPFKATLKDSVWIVMGTKNKKGKGGVAYIEILQRDCTILKVSHGK